MSRFKINILSNDEFDNLSTNITRGSDISDSLGFADPRTGQAYVRFTGVPELNKFLIDHEFEELQADTSTHEDENGIRHKSFARVLRNIAFFPGSILIERKQRKKESGARVLEQQRIGGQQQREAQERARQDQEKIRQQSILDRFIPPPTAPQGPPGAQAGGKIPGAVAPGGLTGGLSSLSPDIKQRLKGFFAGRIPF